MLYCRIYNIEQVKICIKYIQSNILSFIILILVVLFICLGSNFLSKFIAAKSAKEDIVNEIASREKYRRNTNSQSEENNVNTAVEIKNDIIQDSKIIAKHPFSYAYENYKLYRAQKRAIKHSNRLKITKIEEEELLKDAKNNSYSGNASIVFVLISIILLIFLIVVVGDYFLSGDDGSAEWIKTIIQHINHLLVNTTNGLEESEANILNFIMVFGIIILGFIGYILVVYTFTFIWRIWVVLSKRANKNNKELQQLAVSIEQLFSDTVNEMVYLLMFIPDILKNIIGIIYDGDEEDEQGENNNGQGD